MTETTPTAIRRTSRFGLAALIISLIATVLYLFILIAAILGTNLTTAAAIDITGFFTVFGFVSTFFFPLYVAAAILAHIGASMEKRNIQRTSAATTAALIISWVFGVLALLSIAYEIVGILILIFGLATYNSN